MVFYMRLSLTLRHLQMCVNQKCLPVESMRRNEPRCPNDCNGNGFCNNLGHCHCKDSFAPPFCDYPGIGGSEDSGPVKDPNGLCIILY